MEDFVQFFRQMLKHPAPFSGGKEANAPLQNSMVKRRR
jgi:hypothetical protein